MNNIEIGQTWRLKSHDAQVRVISLGGSGKTVFYEWQHDGGGAKTACSSLINWHDLFELADCGEQQGESKVSI